MSKFSFMAFICLVGSVLLLGFQSIARLMGTTGGWKSYSLLKLFGPKYFNWLNEVSLFGIEEVLRSIVNMPLFILLFCLSILLFIIDKFYSK